MSQSAAVLCKVAHLRHLLEELVQRGGLLLDWIQHNSQQANSLAAQAASYLAQLQCKYAPSAHGNPNPRHSGAAEESVQLK